MFVPLILIDIVMLLFNFNDVYVLIVYTVATGCAHIDYGIGVVNEMCDMLKIHCFSLRPL